PRGRSGASRRSPPGQPPLRARSAAGWLPHGPSLSCSGPARRRRCRGRPWCASLPRTWLRAHACAGTSSPGLHRVVEAREGLAPALGGHVAARLSPVTDAGAPGRDGDGAEAGAAGEGAEHALLLVGQVDRARLVADAVPAQGLVA